MWSSNYFKVRNFERKIVKFEFFEKLQNSNDKSYNTVCFAGMMQMAE